MAQEQNAFEIVRIVSALTNLFRISLSKGKEMIEIGEELEHVRSYMIIQKERYKDKMEYEINFEEDILQYQVLKVLLQPIVENAIYHGIKEKRGVGLIIIDVKREDEKIILRVTDNGAGIQSEKLLQINTMLEKTQMQGNFIGYGISNVNERIKLSFGCEFGIRVESIFGEYTIVEICHPLIK